MGSTGNGAAAVRAARWLGAAAVLLGHVAVLLLWWRPDEVGQLRALVVGGVALGCGVLWVVAVARAAGSRPGRRGVGVSAWWDWARLLHLVSLCVPLGALVAAFASAAGEEAGVPAVAVWIATGCALLLTGIMGGIIGGLAFGLVDPVEECWTVRGALRRLRRYAVPFLLVAPWLAGMHAVWSAVALGAALLWLLIAPVNAVAAHIPSVGSSD
ncbi:hypothetical protein [Streptomyces sp. NPDC090025]|uniref:hypothetical protein n=1 Tax=Streptomyces sp. NPDC090025 TaxID=3365922 RepID=UPI003832B76D